MASGTRPGDCVEQAGELGGLPRSARRRGARSRLSHLYRRHHRLVWVAVGLNVAFMLAFTLLVPPFHGTDERAHFDMIHQYQTDPTLRRPDHRLEFVVIDGPVDATGKVITSGPRLNQLRAIDAAPRTNRPTLAELGARVGGTSTDQMTQHPPLYYLGMAELTRIITVPEKFWSWDRELFLARLFSVLFLAPLALLASEAVLALGFARRAGAIAASFTFLIPQKTYLGATVTNDALVILLAAISTVAAVRYLAGAGARNAWVAAVSAAALALTKSTGAVVTAWVLIVLVCGAAQRWRRGDRRDALRVIAVSAFFAAVAASWYVANIIQYHRPQPHPPRVLVTPVPSSFTNFVPRFLDLVSLTFWGLPSRRLGIALPWWVSHTLSVATLVCVVVAVALAVARSRFRKVLALFVVCLAQAAALLQATWATNRFHNLGLTKYLALQGRYLYPVLVPLAALVAVAVFSAGGWLFSQRAVMATTILMLAVGTVLHFSTAQMMLDHYWHGKHPFWRDHLRAVVAWSPLPVVLSYAVLALPFVACAFAIAPVVRRGARHRFVRTA
jgi:hypothetical protein